MAVQVPLKLTKSERLPGKNFRLLAGKPLCFWALEQAMYAADERGWHVFVDSEDRKAHDIACESLPGRNLRYHQRHPAFAEDWANGNDLLNQFFVHHPDFDVYVQLFVTAPLLNVVTMKRVVDAVGKTMRHSGPVGEVEVLHDSAFTATRLGAFVWANGSPVTYDPRRIDGIPRTQDMDTIRETTGIYAVSRDVARTGCRVGRTPYALLVEPHEAIDIDTQADWDAAERIMAP